MAARIRAMMSTMKTAGWRKQKKSMDIFPIKKTLFVFISIILLGAWKMESFGYARICPAKSQYSVSKEEEQSTNMLIYKVI